MRIHKHVAAAAAIALLATACGGAVEAKAPPRPAAYLATSTPRKTPTG